MSCGNPHVILCERGIRTFETHSRNTLDIAAVPILREITHLPIIVDPSHGTGLRNIVGPMAFAAIAVKADGIIVEVHTDPDKSISDAQQTICPKLFSEMMEGLQKIGNAINMTVSQKGKRMKSYKIKPSILKGSISASPSKSQSMRAILFASMACGNSIIKNCLNSPDIDAMIKACQKLGAEITRTQNTLEIKGVSGKPRTPDDVIDVGNSGQVLRFIAAIAALTEGTTVLTGDHSVRYNRPIRPLMEGLSQLGVECYSTKNDDHAPLVVRGPLQPGITSLDGADSQPISGLLIAAAFLNGTTEIHVKNPGEKPWVNLTLHWLDRFGTQYSNDNFEKYTITGNPLIQGFEYTVPGDFSSIAYPIVASLLTQSEITVHNIDMNDAQGDKKIISALRKMGAIIEVNGSTLFVKSGGILTGCEIDVNDFIDAVTILAVVGCYAKGKTILTNAAIARKKESDRLSSISNELKKMGADIIETQDSLIINNSPLNGSSCNSYHDHRIAMSCTIAALGAKNESIINDTECVTKSYPNFVSDLQLLGCDMEVIE